MLAARPAFRYDMTGADRLVVAYFRARNRIPAMHEHLWGAGCIRPERGRSSTARVVPGTGC